MFMTERMKMKCKQDMEEGSSPDRIRYPSLDHLQHRPPSSIPPGTALIGRDQSSRYCALIGGNLQRHFYLLCWIYILLLKPLVSYTLETSPQPQMAFEVRDLVICWRQLFGGGFGCLKLCLYGIRELASATSSIRTSSGDCLRSLWSWENIRNVCFVSWVDLMSLFHRQADHQCKVIIHPTNTIQQSLVWKWSQILSAGVRGS